MNENINWAEIVVDLDQAITRNNSENTNKSSEVAALASVFLMGAVVICTSILLNEPEQQIIVSKFY